MSTPLTPGASGHPPRQRLSFYRANSPLVARGSGHDAQGLFEAAKSSASGYLLKRLDAADFFTYLTQLHAGHAPSSPGLAERILQEFAGQSVPSTSQELPTQGSSSSDPGLPASPPPPVLSPRQILILVAQGQTCRQVAETVGIAERTVKYHMTEILDRLHLENRAQVIACAARFEMGRRCERLTR